MYLLVCVYGHISATTPVLLLLIIECSVWTCAKSLELCAHLWGPDVHMCLCMFRGVHVCMSLMLFMCLHVFGDTEGGFICVYVADFVYSCASLYLSSVCVSVQFYVSPANALRWGKKEPQMLPCPSHPGLPLLLRGLGRRKALTVECCFLSNPDGTTEVGTGWDLLRDPKVMATPKP